MRTSVAIIGAGFSGTLTAIHLSRRCSSDHPIDIYLIDPRGSFGPGLAYSPPSDRFKLNVQAKAMGAFPDDVESFYRWMKERHPNTSPNDFAPRRLYGEYLTDLLAEETRRSTGAVIHQRAEEVIEITRVSTRGEWELTFKSGSRLVVDACVLALGNLMRSPPQPPGSPPVARQPFDPASYENISARNRVVILGSGLTAVDVILECEARGFKGTYTVVSRHGRFPRAHEELPTSAVAHLPRDWDTKGSVRSLVAMIRSESRRLGSSQPVFEAMRPKIQSMWEHLSFSERRRFLRHARPVWEIHRHRIPAEHGRALSRLVETDRLRIVAGRFLQSEGDSSQVTVTIRERGASPTCTLRERFDVAFQCTGPEGDITQSNSPLLRSLVAQGLITPGPLRLGPLRDTSDGAPLWLIGPLRRETLWETTAVREIREQAYEVAAEVRSYLSRAATPHKQ